MPAIDVRGAIPEGGFLHSWLQYARPFQSPDSFFVFALLACASAAVNRRVLVNPGEEPEVFTNTFCVLVGPSGVRKGTAIKEATRLLSDAVPETPIIPTGFTMAGLMDELEEQADEYEEEGSKKCGGLAVAHEFARLIGGVDYQLANLGFLTELWDCPNRATYRTRQHGHQAFPRPYVVLLGSSAEEGYNKIDQSVLDSGGLRRILHVVEAAPKHWETRTTKNSVLFNALAQVFKDRLGPAAFGPTLMRLSDAAHALREEWEKKVLGPRREQASERERYFLSCADAHAIKLGALVTLLETDHPDRMEVGSLRIGQDLVMSIIENQFGFYRGLVPTPYARLKASMLRLLAQSGASGMGSEEFDRAVGDVTGARPEEVLAAKSALQREGRIEMGAGKVRVV